MTAPLEQLQSALARVKTEVGAHRYAMGGRRAPLDKAFIILRVSYRRETHP